MTLTPSERRERALREVEARRPAGLQSVTTLELRHPSLPEPVRLVADNAPLDARLEADAPVEAGQVVTFLDLAFQAAPPEQAEGRFPEIELRLDGAAHLIEPHLEAVLEDDTPIELIWREYIREDALEGPGRVYRGFELDSTRASDLTVSGRAGVYGLDRRFGKTYDLEEYPGLV